MRNDFIQDADNIVEGRRESDLQTDRSIFVLPQDKRQDKYAREINGYQLECMSHRECFELYATSSRLLDLFALQTA